MALTIGTAGHIDHGKTWLVRALTGVETDRLPEEKARGISIVLGYAALELPGGLRVSLVDVPGHERFVRTMVAGATGIDLFLLVIDAAEGARPQTHEHLAILRLLGVEHGVVALTKADTVDEETLELAREEAAELVPGAAIVATSARTGAGLDELRAALARAAGTLQHSGTRPGATRLHVDRAFTLRGIGTVATGTLWSGSLGAGDVVRVGPAGFEARVRSVQVHNADVDRAAAGQRVAVSLPGVERTRIRRGDVLVAPDAFPVGYRLDVALDEFAAIPDGARLHLHHGTARIPARVVRVGERHAQLRLAAPVVAARGDRFVLRAETTLGGGTVLDPAPPRARDEERLERLERRELASTIHEPVTRRSLRHLLDDPDEELAGVERAGDWLFSRAWLDGLRAELAARIAAADPLDPGIAPPPAPWAAAVEPRLGLERRGAKLYAPGSTAALGARAEAAADFESELELAGYEPVRIEDRALAAYLEREGRLVSVGDERALGTAAYEHARDAVVAECERAGSITLARLRDLLGTGRRPAQLLLERLDADGVTRRVGDERVLRRRGRAAAALAVESRRMDRAYGLEIPQSLEDACDPARLALVVYDVQVGILSQLRDGAGTLARVLEVLDAARAAGVRVLFMRHLSLPNELAGVFQLRTAMAWQHVARAEDVRPWFLRDSPGFQLAPELAPRPSEAILDKLTMSAFEGTPLAMVLRDCGVNAFAIVGAATEVGIEPTVRHGADLGFIPIVVTDACAAGNEAAGERALEVLRFAGDAFLTDRTGFRAALAAPR